MKNISNTLSKTILQSGKGKQYFSMISNEKYFQYFVKNNIATWQEQTIFLYDI